MNPLFASVTCGAGGSVQSNTLEIATRLKRDHDVEPMPHLTCVSAKEEDIARSLEEFRNAGLDNLLALRGDRPRDAGPEWRPGTFSCAEELVRFIRSRGGNFGVGVAGYPAPPSGILFLLSRSRISSSKNRNRCGFRHYPAFFRHPRIF